MFKNLKNNYYNEYKMYNLTELSIPLLMPVINKYYANWSPFDNEDEIGLGYDIFKEVKNLLEDSNSSTSAILSASESSSYLRGGHRNPSQIDSFYRIIWETWMPPIKRALINYNIRNCNNVIDFIDLWKPLLPPSMIDNILDNVIMPKLTQEVESWNPLTDTQPIHQWIHPWLPLMSKRLDLLYAPIRHKLSKALTNWHPSDNSARAILLPWRTVFSSSSWDIFMNNNILPKLEKCLKEFEINPRLQNIEPWKWVMDWEGLIPDNNFISLIERAFFPKWFQVLIIWLNSRPNYEEVSRWYFGKK